MKIAIVGGGAAGTACATRLRRLNENDEIVIFEKSGELALSNCGLPYLLSGIVEDGKALIGTTPEQMKQKYNIDCRLNAEVEFINRKEKSVTVKGREPESYDKLIIATGAYRRTDIYRQQSGINLQNQGLCQIQPAPECRNYGRRLYRRRNGRKPDAAGS